MPRGVKKEHLPSKICVICGRPFTWRKKWERVWDEVTTCSKSCNQKRRAAKRNVEGAEYHTLVQEPITDRLSDDRGATLESDNMMESTKDSQDAAAIFDTETLEESEDCSDLHSVDTNSEVDWSEQRKAERKAAKKAKKAERRAQREGRGDPSTGQKKCDMCYKSVDLLIRCTYDEAGAWKMVCGKCWSIASGGVVDGDADHPFYRYGGLWKNRRAQR